MPAESFSMTLHDTSLSPAEIERELMSMWKPIEETAAESTSQSVSRIVLGNVIWIGRSDQMARVRGIVQKVVPRYPCRLFLLEYQPDRAESRIEAAVNAQCFVPQKGAPPVCCEVIHMTFGPTSTHHLRGCVAPLLLPDLATVLWESLAGIYLDEFSQLQEYVDRTITQASLVSRPDKVLRRLVEAQRPAYDLAWFRMAPIREQVTASFDDAGMDFDLREIESIHIGTVEHEPASLLPELIASLLTGWMGSRLGWEPGGGESDCYLFKSPSGPVRAVLEPACRRDAKALNNLSVIELVDRRARRFQVMLNMAARSMNIVCGLADCEASGGRHLVLSELSEAEALGDALNRPVTWRHFRESARLAIPLLENLERTHRGS